MRKTGRRQAGKTERQIGEIRTTVPIRKPTRKPDKSSPKKPIRKPKKPDRK